MADPVQTPNTPQPPSEGGKSEFERAGQEQQPSLIVEFIEFLKYNKKWWLLPIVIVLALVGLLVFLASTGVAPFIYPI
jgi:hypothetical protein